MPKPTFFNLSTEKQECLMEAAKKEFSRVSLYEASISNIIKDAKIARGSFYQYFDDKEDIFFFMLDEHSKRIYELFLSIIKKNNGDLFKSIMDWFKSYLKLSEKPDDRRFIKNAFLNMNYKIEKTFTQNMYEENVRSKFSEIMNYVNSENLNVTSEEEIYYIFKILMAVTFQNLVQVFARGLHTHEAIKTLSFQIELLKKGFYRENE